MERLNEKVTRLDQMVAPYGREITVENVDYENGTRVLRVRIRENKRFTVMDLNEATASRLGAVMGEWAQRAAERDS